MSCFNYQTNFVLKMEKPPPQINSFCFSIIEFPLIAKVDCPNQNQQESYLLWLLGDFYNILVTTFESYLSNKLSLTARCVF